MCSRCRWCGFPSKCTTQLILERGRHPGCSFITPPGQGFLPRETALHHQEWAVRLVQQALAEAKVSPQDISVIAFTKVWLPIRLASCIPAGDAVQVRKQQGAWFTCWAAGRAATCMEWRAAFCCSSRLFTHRLLMAVCRGLAWEVPSCPAPWLPACCRR